jgi:predicted ATPase/class 3 adenylate cyclase
MPQGTLTHISPEQTGRINRFFDYRTDLYSLGVIYYELFTGRLPFTEVEPMALIHAHIARLPEPPAYLNKEIPEMVSSIIVKLLEKTPEERYRSARGIKNDLIECARRWKESREISLFPLGLKDPNDKLIIPQKLYGRENEFSVLIEGLSRSAVHGGDIMLVSGNSGIGKSVLIRELRRPVIEKNGYFIQGKFDQFQRDIPFSAIIQSFRELCAYLLSGEASYLATIRESLLKALGNNGHIIISVIPEIELIIGTQPPVSDLPPAETQNRFKMVFRNFIRTFTGSDQPMAIFLDDLQWADQASLDLITLLATDPAAHGLYLIGAYRNNETEPTHPLYLALKEIKNAGFVVREVLLQPLNQFHIETLLSDTLNSSKETVGDLAVQILQKTQGTPFFVNEFIKKIYNDKILYFNQSSGGWKWDIERLSASNITDNVIDLMTGKILDLSEKATQTILVAAAIGNRFDFKTLGMINNQVSNKTSSETADNLMEVMKEGLILPQGETYKLMTNHHDLNDENEIKISFRFLHDRVQQAAYLLLKNDQKKEIHLAIGRVLNKRFSGDEKNRIIFDLTNHLNAAVDLITDESENHELILLNIEAAIIAKKNNAYLAALNYAQMGIKMLFSQPSDQVWTSNYKLSMELHCLAVEAAYLEADFNALDYFSKQALEHAHSALDVIRIHETLILSFIAQNELFNAVKYSIKVLSMLGVKFPGKPKTFHILFLFLKIKFNLRSRNILALENLPEMKDQKIISAMRIMTSVFSATYISFPIMMPLFVMKQVQLSLQYGNHPLSAFSYANFGLILGALMGQVSSGYSFGQLALALSNREESKSIKTKTYFSVYSFISHLKEPIYNSFEPLHEACKNGLETGDLEYAGWTLLGKGYAQFLTGCNLEETENNLEECFNVVSRFNQASVLSKIGLWHESVKNLLGKTSNTSLLSGSSYDEIKMYDLLKENSQAAEMMQLIVNKLLLAVIFEEKDVAKEMADKGRFYIESVPGTIFLVHYFFYDTLARLAAFSELSRKQQKNELKILNGNFKKMKTWVGHNPENHLQKLQLMEAGYLWISGKGTAAGVLYDTAIKSAIENKNQADEALALELAGNFHIKNGRDRIAATYFQDALYVYKRWGAHAKVKMLHKKYPGFFNSETDGRIQAKSTNKSIDSLDLTTVLKASMALSGDIVLDRLLDRLMKIAIENAGAQSGALFLYREKTLCLAGKGFAEKGTILTGWQDIDIVEDFPKSIIYYVERTREDIVLGDAGNDSRFLRDTYIKENSIKSILCITIQNVGLPIGILYLENNLVAGAFTHDRIELLKMLSGQIGVSLNNAMLYENLDQKVKDRTKEIELEKAKSDELLLNILPEETARDLKLYGKAKVKRYESVTVLFTDFKDFTRIAESMDPEELVVEIDFYFRAFDEISGKYGLEKIKTIGDSYMCCGGLPVENSSHPIDTVNAAREINRFVIQQKSERKNKGLPFFDLRIGIHTGPVVAGVVGVRKFAYDIWGDTVNIASRMEASCEPGKINLSGETAFSLKGKVNCIYRGKLDIKNRGQVDMYYVDIENM